MYQSRLKSPEVDALFEAILTLENEDDCYRFFEDLCTINELQALAQRLWVVRMLRQRATYQEIAKTTGASTATISRVNRSLLYGAEGYSMVMEKLDKREEQTQSK